MQTTTHASGERIAAPDRAPAELLDVKSVAHLLTCSTRTVYRLSDSNSMPRNIKLGALCRWSRSAVMDWIERGCPNCRMGGGAK